MQPCQPAPYMHRVAHLRGKLMARDVMKSFNPGHLHSVPPDCRIVVLMGMHPISVKSAFWVPATSMCSAYFRPLYFSLLLCFVGRAHASGSIFPARGRGFRVNLSLWSLFPQDKGMAGFHRSRTDNRQGATETVIHKNTLV